MSEPVIWLIIFLASAFLGFCIGYSKAMEDAKQERIEREAHHGRVASMPTYKIPTPPKGESQIERYKNDF